MENLLWVIHLLYDPLRFTDGGVAQ